MLSMITSQAISISSVLGSMSRSLQLLNILSMFDIQGPGLKVKVTVAIFRKTLFLLLCLDLLMDFNIISQKC